MMAIGLPIEKSMKGIGLAAWQENCAGYGLPCETSGQVVRNDLSSVLWIRSWVSGAALIC